MESGKDLKAVEKILVEGSKKLYIFFGGIVAGIVIPPFEFFNASKLLQENKIFLRDFSQSWYHGGITGIGPNIEAIADYLRSEISSIAPAEVIFVGNSMGGYAAILFSTLTEYGRVIAFSPQTFIGQRLRNKYVDLRWAEQIARTHQLPFYRAEYEDLRAVLLSASSGCQVAIYVAADYQLDCHHANYISDIAGVHIHTVQGQGHEIIKNLRDTGKLAHIMVSASQ